MSVRREVQASLRPEGWLRPATFTFLAAAWVLLGDLQLCISMHFGRHSVAHTFWNRRLLLVLVLATLLWAVLRQGTRLRAGHAAGLSLAAMGLGARGLVEIAMTAMDRSPPLWIAPHATPVRMVEATRWLGLAAYAVGMTLFAVEILGWWIDRRRART